MTSTSISMDGFTRYRHDQDFIRGFAAARQALGVDEAAAANSVAMLLFSPLALRAARVRAGLKWLTAHGFSVGYVCRVRLDRGQVRRIWKYQPVEYDAERVRIVCDLMTSGPCLLVLVTGTEVDGLPLASRLRTLKGPSNPHRCSPEHLRTHLGAANMFNNLVHTSDGPVEVMRECAVMLTDTELATLWRCVSDSLSGSSSPPGLDEALAGIPTAAIPGGISLAHVAIALRAELLRHIGTPMSSRTGRLAEVEYLLAAEMEWAQRQDPARPVQALHAFRARFSPVHPLLQASLVPMRGLLSLFDDVEHALFGMPFGLDSLNRSASAANITLDVRDRLVLETEWLSLRFSRGCPSSATLS
ncbi:nucleoside-diphosphate kinase [Nocardia sp. NPDC049220]|uniref:nucleoside-diphosphate kinase n=1 Tax=Nocardia sp. NPDC049220 TaxID=3155273 RepID=UPI0034081014